MLHVCYFNVYIYIYSFCFIWAIVLSSRNVLLYWTFMYEFNCLPEFVLNLFPIKGKRNIPSNFQEDFCILVQSLTDGGWSLLCYFVLCSFYGSAAKLSVVWCFSSFPHPVYLKTCCSVTKFSLDNLTAIFIQGRDFSRISYEAWEAPPNIDCTRMLFYSHTLHTNFYWIEICAWKINGLNPLVDQYGGICFKKWRLANRGCEGATPPKQWPQLRN